MHLLGVGHVHRAKRLIEGFHEAGILVDVIYGGEKIPSLQLKADSIGYLSPIKSADNAYSSYLDEDGNPLTKGYQEKRKSELLNIFEKLNPDAILIEAFPFGRRIIRHEMHAFLQAASLRSPRPIIVSSVRDILQERKKPQRIEETVGWINSYFDKILVHSDPNIIELDATFPSANQIKNKINYTGFVIPENKTKPIGDDYDILVSAGGGAFGGSLMEMALAAAHEASERQWSLVTGPNLEEEIYAKLHRNKPDNVTLKRHVENLSSHMQHARISISQCGYNTAMDVLAAHHESACRAVFVPYDTEGQTEQLSRAQLLENSGFAINLPQSKLTVKALLSAVKEAENLKSVEIPVDFDGVKNSARLLKQWLSNR